MERETSETHLAKVQALFGAPKLKVTLAKMLSSEISSRTPQLFYSNTNGQLWIGDSLIWLKSIPSNSVDLIFADPPYNIKKAKWDTFSSHNEYVEWLALWVKEASRILTKTALYTYAVFPKS